MTEVKICGHCGNPLPHEGGEWEDDPDFLFNPEGDSGCPKPWRYN